MSWAITKCGMVPKYVYLKLFIEGVSKWRSDTIDVESLLNFNGDLNLQQPKKDILYYVQIVPSHTSFSLILYLLSYVENQHKISRNLNNKTREYSSLKKYL